MIERTFTLIPFPSQQILSISITGDLSFHHNFLTLHYALSGDLDAILLPPASDTPRRRDELWQSTCFEFFLAHKDQPGYWEFNLSPSGDWNVYWMDTYRRIGFREEAAISLLPFVFKRSPEGYSLDVSVDLKTILEPGNELQMAITAILQTRDGNETFWALTHPAPYPDFHLREGFVLQLAEQTHPSPQSALDG